MTDIDKFFSNIFGTKRIYFRCLKQGSKNIDFHSLYNEKAIEILQRANGQNYEVYFVSNIGGYKEADITEIIVVFLDLDCGRDEDGEYYPLDVTSEYKRKKLDQLQRYIYKPSGIVETRNGLQTFWVLNAPASVEEFRECQNRLIAHFDGDKKVKKVANLMRVPGFLWCKYPDQKYPITIIEQNDGKHDIHDIINSLDSVEYMDKSDNNKNKYYTLLPIVDTNIPRTSNEMIQLIRDRNVEKLQSIIEPSAKKCNTHDDVYEQLKTQDLWLLLGLTGSSFQCIFHEDRKPSAGIIVNEESGHHIYCCQSSNCMFGSGTIIKCIERILRCSKTEALRFLRKVYRIEYQETEWQKEQKEILEENRRYIMSEDFEVEYPYLYKRVRSYLRLLCTLINFGLDHVFTESFSRLSDSQATFFISARHMAKMCGNNLKRSSERSNLFTFFGLLEKLREDEIPEFLLKKAKHEAAKKKQQKIINFYSIPSYSESILSVAEKKAKEMYERKIPIRAWSREMVLRTFGEEEADRVFPQLKGKPLSDMNREVSEQLEHILLSLIAEYGWTTERKVIEQAKVIGIRKAFKETQLKRILPEFLEKYSLTKRKLNKQLKSDLGITDAGFFEVIYQEA